MSDSYLFVPQDLTLAEEYGRWYSVKDIFPVSSVGIVTARDALTIHFTEEETWSTVADFAERSPEDARSHYQLGADVRDWRVALAQDDIRKDGPNRSRLWPILYRPFDERWTYYTGQTRGFICMPRPEVMRHMLAGENVALSTTRSTEVGDSFTHVFISRYLLTHHTVSLKEVNYVFPLYLFPHNESLYAERTPNLAPAFFAAVAERIDRQPAPEEIFSSFTAFCTHPRTALATPIS